MFSPVAGWLSKGVAPAEFGPEVSDHIRLDLPVVERVSEKSLRGVVLKVDKFGNLISNFGEQEAPALFAVTPPSIKLLIAGQTITPLCRSYDDGGDDEFIAIYLKLGSDLDLREACQTSASGKLSAGVGTPVGIILGEEGLFTRASSGFTRRVALHFARPLEKANQFPPFSPAESQ